MSVTGKSGGGGGRKNPRLHQKVKTARGRKNGSTKWLQRQLNDPYVQKARALGYRSRAAFKISELDDKFKFFKPNLSVVDLGAAPGGWTQVAVERCKGNSTVVAIDLLQIDEIAGSTLLEMDFMADDAPEKLCSYLPEGKADLVISDMAPNTSGTPSLDHLRIMGLVEAAAEFACEILKPGGGFVCKVWQGGAERETLKALQKRFIKVRHAKPAASRKGSAETFLVASGFKG
ncbi:MAG: RlmE family RNA methyltransferase [Rickettsiales bacterium]|nr:RlmE family RNA methyltransferase [Rickettsiales bacterium]